MLLDSAEVTTTGESPERYFLGADETFKINPRNYLPESVPLNDSDDLSARAIAEIDAGGKHFLILDTHGIDKVQADYLLIDDDFDWEGRTGYKGIREGEPSVVVGRSHLNDRFLYPATTSREHFEISSTADQVIVHNLNPVNGTMLLMPAEREPRPMPAATPTWRAVGRAAASPNYGEPDSLAPYGYYMNHPILGRNSAVIENGISMGGGPREAIVVDGKSRSMQQAYARLREELRLGDDRLPPTLTGRGLALQVKHLVAETLRYSDAEVDRLTYKHFGDQPIPLSTLVEAGYGVCRHQALLAAWLIEKLIEQGDVNGAVRVERNRQPGGAHAWAVFIQAGGEPIVIDAAQNFVGTKAQARTEGMWDYYLASDLPA